MAMCEAGSAGAKLGEVNNMVKEIQSSAGSAQEAIGGMNQLVDAAKLNEVSAGTCIAVLTKWS